MAEPTSTLTFESLLIQVAEKLGVAYYGAAGDEVAQVPTNAQDLALCQRLVNNAIRMFIHDGPQPNGWRWLRPVAEVVLWADIATDATNLISSATLSSGVTTLVVPTAKFYPSMELHDITVTGVGTFTISEYVSATSVKVTGDASAATGKTWSMTADGNYTLPLTFGGQYLGGIEYAAGTNRGIGCEWVDESTIRHWRANVQSQHGDPYLFAVRVMDTGSPRRRWELLAYNTPDETLTVEFPYMLHFDALTSNTQVHPAPFSHDETIKAACEAVCEKEVERLLGVAWGYYREVALPNSYRVDAMSAPKKLSVSRRGASIQEFRDRLYQRPTVTFNP